MKKGKRLRLFAFMTKSAKEQLLKLYAEQADADDAVFHSQADLDRAAVEAVHRRIALFPEPRRFRR